MTGKDRELVDMMQRGKMDGLCVQETKWKDRKDRSIGAGFKLYSHDVVGKTNGVGVILKNVVEVNRL